MLSFGRLLAILALFPLHAFAQVPITQLPPANGHINATYTREPLNEALAFRRVLQELTDGRVLISQAEGDQMLLADFAKGTVEVQKNFPTGQLIPLSGDSSIIKRMAGWQFFHNLRNVGMLAPERASRLFAVDTETIYAADEAGRLLIESRPRSGDSTVVNLVDRGSGSRLTIAKLWRDNPPPGVRPVCKQNERVVLAADGWIAILRANPYRVDWRRPSGEWIRGRNLQPPPQPMTTKDRAAYLEWQNRDRLTIPRDTARNWPESPCAWVDGYSPKAAPDGTLLVYRVPTSSIRPTLYDVINREGLLVRQLQLPSSEAIIAFGKSSAYVTRTTSEGQSFSRHPWP